MLSLFNQGRTRRDPFVHGRLDSSTFPPDKWLSSRWLDKTRTVSYPGDRLHTFWITGVWFRLSTFLTGDAKCGHLNEKYIYISFVIVFSWGFYLISVLWCVQLTCWEDEFLNLYPHHPSGSLTLFDLGSILCKPFKNRLWSCISSELTTAVYGLMQFTFVHCCLLMFTGKCSLG